MKIYAYARHPAHIWMAFLIAALSLLSLQQCTKMPINDGLDGKWQVMEVSEQGESIVFPEGKRYYFNFYLHVCQLAEEYGYISGFTASMSYSDGLLILDFPYVKDGSVSISDINTLRYWGIPTSGEAVFKINELTSSGLVMSSGSTVVRCRRF